MSARGEPPRTFRIALQDARDARIKPVAASHAPTAQIAEVDAPLQARIKKSLNYGQPGE